MTQEYDQEGNRKRRITYDLQGNPVKETDGVGAVTLYRYDLAGHLVEKREPSGEAGNYQLIGIPTIPMGIK